jgi:hypothetical protein
MKKLSRGSGLDYVLAVRGRLGGTIQKGRRMNRVSYFERLAWARRQVVLLQQEGKRWLEVRNSPTRRTEQEQGEIVTTTDTKPTMYLLESTTEQQD